MNILRNFAKSVFAHIFAKFKYFAKQFILTESPDQKIIGVGGGGGRPEPPPPFIL